MTERARTDSYHVAGIEAALEIAKKPRSNDASETRFAAYLQRFLIAYKAIAGSMGIGVKDVREMKPIDS